MLGRTSLAIAALLVLAAACGKGEPYEYDRPEFVFPALDASEQIDPDGTVIVPDAGVGLDADRPDVFVRDTGVRDTGVRDSGPRDTGVRDTGVRDTGVFPDATVPDAGFGDSGVTPVDAGRRDTGVIGDASVVPDAGTLVDGGATMDATTTTDGGTTTTDGGTTTTDGGTTTTDGGTTTTDGGTTTTDAMIAIDGGAAPDAMTTTDGAVTTDAMTAPDSGVECVIDSDCGFLGHCEPASHTCVQCLVDADCGPGGLVCDTTGGFVCRVPCFGGMCGPLGVCDPSSNLCVQCLADTDCNGDELCDPATHSCVMCISDADCALHPGQPICDLSTNECTACRDNADCAAPDECITTGPGDNFCAPPTGRGLCEPCSADDECGGPDDLCIGYVGGGGGLFDRSCGIDCTADPTICPNGFECTSVRMGSAMQCRPSYPMTTPTCRATRNLLTSCPYSMTALDPGCGYSGVQDARCVPDPSGGPNGVCTVWCNVDEDCAIGICVGATSTTNGHCL